MINFLPMKMMLVAVIVTLAALTLVVLWMAGVFRGKYVNDIRRYSDVAGQPRSTQSPIELTVMTWNIGYGYGIGSEGVRYSPKSKSDIENALVKMAEVISAHQTDIVLLQEIDFDSSRSHRQDQLAFLSQKTGLPFGATAVSWDANYVPFPYWPPADHFAKVVSGGAVLSRYPIVGNEVHYYEKPNNNPWWYNLFYLDRYTQKALIELPDGRHLAVFNSHLEAFDIPARRAQAQQLAVWVWESGESLRLFGGDFNTVPVGAVRHHDFGDHTHDDYRGDSTLEVLSASGFREVIPMAAYLKDESKYWSFPSNQPNRRLDYMFVPKKWTVESVQILPVGVISDHLPLLAKLSVKESLKNVPDARRQGSRD